MVNVYFKRNTYTITFVDGKKTILTLTAKYDSDITNTWEQGTIKTYLDNGYVFVSSITGDYYTFLERMPAVPKQGLTMTAMKLSGDYTYTWYYYLETIDGTAATAPSGATTKTQGGKVYYLYHTSSVEADGLVLTYDEDYFPIPGFTQLYAKGQGGWNWSYYYGSYVHSFDNNTAYLYYTRNSYTLTLNNYGNEDSSSVRYEASIANKGAAPSRPASFSPNAVFKGWYAVEPKNITPQTIPYSFTGKTMPAHNLVFYAYWQEPAIHIKIVVNLPGASDFSASAPAGTSVYGTGTTYNSALAAIQAAGETLLKWVDGSGNLIDIYQALYSDTTVYAVYAGRTYQVKYAAGAGSGTGPVDSSKYGGNSFAKVMASTFTPPSGQLFAYWTDAAGQKYYPGQSVLILQSDVLLTANYVPASALVSVTYHSNFGTDQAMTTAAVSNNSKITVLGYADTGLPSRTGYDFTGWATNAAGTGTKFTAGASARVDNTGDNDLYATWAISKKTLAVTKEWAAGTPNSAKVAVHIYLQRKVSGDPDTAWQTVAGTRKEFSETAGWNHSYTGLASGVEVGGVYKQYIYKAVEEDVPGFTASYSPSTPTAGTTAITVTNTPINYTVTYKKGAHGTLSDPSILPDAEGSIVHTGVLYGLARPTEPTVNPDAGYEFASWDPEFVDIVKGNQVYTATYVPKNYTLTYELKATDEAGNPLSVPATVTTPSGTPYTVEAPATVANLPSVPSGWTIDGWYMNDGWLAADKYNSATYGAVGGGTLYAHLVATNYTLT